MNTVDFKHPPICYRPEGAADAMSVSVMTVNQWLREGRLIARKSGNATLILRDDLFEMVRTLPVAKYAPPPTHV